MQLATIIPPTIQPELPFAQASTLYQRATKALEFPANAKVDVRAAIGSALTDTQSAIALLEPAASFDDMFVSRNAKASIEAAKTGVSALSNALATLEAPGAGMPQIPVSTFLAVAKSSLTQADSALFWE
jgi:hypothetical protein